MSDTSDPLGPQEPDALPRSGWHRLRNYFLTGLVVVVPLFLTVYLTWALIVWIDSWVTPLIPAAYKPDKWLPVSIPGFGVLIALFVITILGFLTANLAGRPFVAWRESLLAGFMGALASQCWFIGFALTSTVNVRTLGLVEVLFAQLVSRRVFDENTSTRERLGMALVTLGVLLLLWQQA